MRPEEKWVLLPSDEGTDLDGEELFGGEVWNGLLAEIESAVSRPAVDAISEYDKALKEAETLDRAFEAERTVEEVSSELESMEESEVGGATEGSQSLPTAGEIAGGLAKVDRHCPACGMAVPPNARFCGHCGEVIPTGTAAEETEPVTCPGCAAPLMPGVKFCGNCGRKIPSRS